MTEVEQHLMTIFAAALDRGSAAERAAYLDEACGADAPLRERVDALLRAHEQAGEFLEHPRSGHSADASITASAYESITERPGTVIGPYKLLEQIGEGGFGVVFMAEQTQPVRRKVALKVLKPGMDTRQVIARFEAERQALALMDHPNIAHVLDGGETASGRPYFVMELVRGIPITEFCDQNHLPVRARLDLFVSVCQAVQHAHQKGIIHRDLKPSNVMVTLHDDKPVVKVIDFGIAKASGQQLTEKTLFTNFAQMIGTPLYMSPEQAQMSGLDIDTRSDIYSLGVLLYELLTGTTPFDQERFRKAAYDEMRRIIREEEPAPPSTRISTLGQAAGMVSANRGSDAKRLTQLCRGELDWIVMKSLEKDRNRRYETANGLARDVERYLRDEPVQACPPSASYRLRKLARRHKAALITASLLVAMLLLGTGISVWQAITATQARDAETEARIELSAAKQIADDQAAQIGRDLERLNAANDLIEGGQFHVGWGEWAKAESAFTSAVNKRRDHARGWTERAQFYTRLGLWDLATADFGQAFALQEPSLSIFWYFHALLCLDAGDMNSYRDLCKRMHERFASALHPQTCDEVARTCLLAADPVVDRAKLVQLMERAVADGKSPWRLTDLATAYYRTGEYEKAVARLREAQALDPRWEPIRCNAVLAMAYYRAGQTGLAAKCLDAATAARSQRIQAMIQNGPGYLPSYWWDVVQSNVHYREAKALIEGPTPRDDPEAPKLLVIRSRALAALGRNSLAIDGLSQALKLDSKLVSAWTARAEAWRRRGAWDKARSDYQRAIDLNPKADSAQNSLAWLLATCPDPRFRDPQAAVAWAEKAVDLVPTAASYRNTLGVAFYRAADWQAAVAALLKSVELSQGGSTEDCLFLAMAHWRLDRKETARRWFGRALERAQNVILANHDELRRFRAEAAALLGLPEDGQATPKLGLRPDLELCTLVLETDAGAVWARQRRASALLELKDWNAAAVDLTKAVELNPGNVYAWYQCATVLLLAEKTADYRSLCAKMQQRFVQTTDLEVGGWLINTCVLGPEATADFLPVLQLAEHGATNYWHTLWRLGAANYRADRFEAAIEHMQRAGQVHKNGGNAFSWLVIAMAHHKLGHSDEARQWLTKATRWIEQATESNVNDPYLATPMPLRYSLPLQVLRREAESLLNGPAINFPAAAGKKSAAPK
jgi:serine/threonine protein kinase/Flp pilus assembly protein TadD